MPSYKIARDARTGRFISFREACRRPATSVVEKVHISRNGVRRLKFRRPARGGFKAGKDI